MSPSHSVEYPGVQEGVQTPGVPPSYGPNSSPLLLKGSSCPQCGGKAQLKRVVYSTEGQDAFMFR